VVRALEGRSVFFFSLTLPAADLNQLLVRVCFGRLGSMVGHFCFSEHLGTGNDNRTLCGVYPSPVTPQTSKLGQVWLLFSNRLRRVSVHVCCAVLNHAAPLLSKALYVHSMATER
jgi:hypothetical protein